jgi:hypothetical protein
MKYRLFLFLLAFAATLCATSANATQWTFNVFMDGASERPTPVVTTGSGTATVLYDDVTGAMNVNGTFANLLANTTAAHIHGLCDANTACGVLFGLSVDPGTSGNVSGSGNIANSASVLAGNTYLNIHSNAYPGGEIRGQLVNAIPEPATCVMLALGSLGLLAFRRRTH